MSFDDDRYCQLCSICNEKKDCPICFGTGKIRKRMCSRGFIENKCLWCNGTGHMKHGRKLSITKQTNGDAE